MRTGKLVSLNLYHTAEAAFVKQGFAKMLVC
jgi:hypothetical protein